MSINVVPIANRSMGLDPQITANGSYTLPKYAFVPHASLHQLSGARVEAPTDQSVASATFAAPWQLARDFPTLAPVYGVRSVHTKRHPGT
jgi:hypothetical protein